MKKLLLILTALCLISSPALAKSKKANAEQFSCEDTKYCKEMRSCAEAKFHLNECGESRLDRDGDGVPCENVCG
jgi:prophage muMc02, nuclease, putative|nr:MAG TPA: Excalibur calcium-binding domain protein [Caudoviricetes sp.]DAT04240.1 MAG TPA: Excalibur calcium-binding domain protein [Caudoviricetes sp.]